MAPCVYFAGKRPAREADGPECRGCRRKRRPSVMRGIGRVPREPRGTEAWPERAPTSGGSFIARAEGDIPNLETQWDGQKPCAPKDGRTDIPLTPDLFELRRISGFRKCVRRLQLRIAKAHREGKPGKVKTLQRILIRSLAARVLAVWRVTTNKGKRTPGVDRVTWKTPEQRTEAVNVLKRRGYKPQPLRRIFIPKKNGKFRPLSIPTMHDRTMQAVYLQPSSLSRRRRRIRTPMGLDPNGPQPMPLNSDIFCCLKNHRRSGFWRATYGAVSTRSATHGSWKTSRWTKLSWGSG